MTQHEKAVHKRCHIKSRTLTGQEMTHKQDVYKKSGSNLQIVSKFRPSAHEKQCFLDVADNIYLWTCESISMKVADRFTYFQIFPIRDLQISSPSVHSRPLLPHVRHTRQRFRNGAFVLRLWAWCINVGHTWHWATKRNTATFFISFITRHRFVQVPLLTALSIASSHSSERHLCTNVAVSSSFQTALSTTPLVSDVEWTFQVH